MKQLTILCSEEIRDKVMHALNSVDLQGYAEVGNVTGNRPKDKRYIDIRAMTWPATMFIALAGDEKVRQIIEGLKDYSDLCEIQPCLRVIVTEVVEYC